MRIGIDVVDIARLKDSLERSPNLEERLFTAAERDYCRASADPFPHFAGTLAAKEAVIKALRLGNLPQWARRIEITRDGDGAPAATVESDGEPPDLALSITHDGPVAVAVCLAGSS